MLLILVADGRAAQGTSCSVVELESRCTCMHRPLHGLKIDGATMPLARRRVAIDVHPSAAANCARREVVERGVQRVRRPKLVPSELGVDGGAPIHRSSRRPHPGDLPDPHPSTTRLQVAKFRRI
jgi:hypothetical protein